MQTSSPPGVLILGANGRLGSAAAEAFWSAGWRVIAQVRRGDLAIPLDDTTALARAAAGASVVVFAVNPLYTAWDSQMLPLARAGMDIAQRLGALFMLPGNVYNYGAGMPARLDEHTPERPSTDKGRLRRQLEAELAERAGSGLRSVVIRAGDFYGHGAGSWIDQLIAKKLTSGKLSYPGPMDIPHAWAYLPDLARAFVAVAEQARQGALNDSGHTRVQFSGHTLTGHQLLDGLTRAAQGLGLPAAGDGRQLRHNRMHWAPVRLAGLFVPTLRELAKMAYLWHVPHALDGSALQRLVGPLSATPVDIALRQTLEALGHGLDQGIDQGRGQGLKKGSQDAATPALSSAR